MYNDDLLAGPEWAPKLWLSFYVHVHVDYMLVHVCTCTLHRIYFGALVKSQVVLAIEIRCDRISL